MSESNATRKINKKINAINPITVGPVQSPQQSAVRPVPTVSAQAEAFNMPLHVNTVDGNIREVQLETPDLDKIRKAYQQADFELTDSRRKQSKRLEESKDRYRLQESLDRKERASSNQNAPQNVVNLSLKKAMDLSDEDLVKNANGYSGADSYLAARYSLIRNKYYALFPPTEMRKLSFKELLSRLRSEYAKKPAERNKSLIAYYQTLYNLKNMEEPPEEDTQPPADPPLEITDKERNYNKKYLEKNLKLIDSLHISDEEKQQRRDTMKKIMVSNAGDRFWDEKTDEQVSPAQKEGVRQILAWMYRNCNKSSESKEGFVYKLTKGSPGQLLLLCYLVENDLQSSPSSDCFLRLKANYVPDLNSFKGKVIASKAKFWKRIGPGSSDDVIDWAKIGSAARFAMKCDEIKDYEDHAEKEKNLNEELEKPENDVREKKAELLYDLLIVKGNRMLALYKAAGLTPDMPTDMIRDETLRRETVAVISDFSVTLGKLKQIEGYVGKKAGKDFTDKTGAEADPAALLEDDNEESVMDKVSDIFEKIELGLNANDVLDVIGEPVSVLTDNLGYSLSAGCLIALNSLVTIISGFVTAADIASSGSSLSLADHTAQALSVSGDIIEGAADLVQSTADMVGKFVDLGEATDEATSWIGNTAVQTASESFSTVSGGIQFCTGCVTLLAGGIQTTAGIIEIGRGVSSRGDVKRSRDKLKTMETKPQGLTEDQKALRRLLSHQDRAVTTQEVSGTVKMVGGILTMVGGALTVSGILAPLGGILAITGSLLSIGTNLLYARTRRRLNMRQAVDDALTLDSIIEVLKQQYPDVASMSKSGLSKLKDQMRQEALAELGYSNYKEFFSDLSKKNAIMIYEHVFRKDEGADDKSVFMDALKSFGLKIRKAEKPGEKNLPTPEMIYAKLMA